MSWIGERVMQGEVDTKRSKDDVDIWFATTILMPRPNTALPHPDTATNLGGEGFVTAIHRPHGGVVTCGEVTVFFHRSRYC